MLLPGVITYILVDHSQRPTKPLSLMNVQCTEEQLAALLEAVRGVERLILVGDPKQLPPIGAGRPFVDIVEMLKPDNIDTISPRVASCYAELTIVMRQNKKKNTDNKEDQERTDIKLVNSLSSLVLDAGSNNIKNMKRTDVLLANSFSGRALDSGADEVLWHQIKRLL